MQLLTEMDPNARLEYVGKVIDMTLAGLPVEVKSCQYYIGNGGRGWTRHGLFKFNKQQHMRLMEELGVYLFLVFMNGILVGAELVPAEKIDYHPQISWVKIVKKR